MKIAKSKLLREVAKLYPPAIEKRSGDWVIVLHVLGTVPSKRHPLLISDKGFTRKFKTLDAAYNTCKEIGFKNINIVG